MGAAYQACNRLDEYPFLMFSADSTIFCKRVEQYASEVLARIQKHMRSKPRWNY